MRLDFFLRGTSCCGQGGETAVIRIGGAAFSTFARLALVDNSPLEQGESNGPVVADGGIRWWLPSMR